MKRLILALTFGAFAAGSASAQLRLTLDDAIQMALSENPTIKVADLDVERYDYVKKETRGNLLPSLSASGEYTRAIEKSTMRGGISFGADNTFTGTASLSVPLFAPAVYRTLKLNRTQIASAVEAARSSRITLVAEVKKAFYNILLAEQSLATLEESRATIQRTVDDTKVKFEQGVASEYDLPDGAGGAEQSASDHYADEEFDSGGHAATQNVPVGSRGVVDRAGRQP